jgi:N,N-dimethylformamidase
MGRLQAALEEAYRPGPGARLRGTSNVLEIIGYADRMTVRPGERIAFKVSCEAGATRFRARIVRLICGDDSPEGPGYKEQPVASSIEGDYPGRRQVIHAGSSVIVPATPVLDQVESFVVSANIWPTTPGRGEQLLIGRRQGDAGFALVVGPQGDLALRLGERLIGTGSKLRPRQWYAVEARYDAASGEARVTQTPLANLARDDSAGEASGFGRLVPPPADCQLVMGAGYNGKLEAPRLADLARGVVGQWDFSQGIGGMRIVDMSGHGLHGETINLPTRGMTGAAWNGQAFHWRDRPDLYGAIHFHDDDLYDCGWQTDFAWAIPDDLPSGVYAAHLACGPGETQEDWIPFFVCPPEGRANAPLAFLASTATYMAYANSHHGYEDPLAEICYGALLEFTPPDLFLRQRRDLGVSTYDRHADGSGACYSSRLRPILNTRPKRSLWNFNADLHVVDWLTATGQAFDIITDEDLHREGLALLAPYRAVMTGTHPEYHSGAMLDAIEAYLGRGGRLIYMGGNGFYWRTAFHPDLPGVIEVRRGESGTRTWQGHTGEMNLSFTGEPGGLWRSNGRAPQRLVGVGFASEGFDVNSYFLRTAERGDSRAAFVFEGVGADERIGDFGSLGGAAGFELDIADPELGTPPHALVLARSVEHSNVYAVTPEELISAQPGTDGIEHPKVRADMTFFETPQGGAVFSTGSIAWASALAHNGYENNVARITGNVLRRFLDPTPFE